MKEVIACLDIKDGRVVTGVQFQGLQEMGEPVELAEKYAKQKVDELVILDIGKPSVTAELVSEIKNVLVDIPLTVGGGISSIDRVDELLNAGSDQVSISSAAIRKPELINEITKKYGKNRLTIAVDVGFDDELNDYYIFTQGGREREEIKALDWIKEVERRGAGRLLITSIKQDGAQTGFDLDFLKKACQVTDLPIIASGGAGSEEDFIKLFKETNVTSALAASIFHQDKVNILDLKDTLKKEGIY